MMLTIAIHENNAGYMHIKPICNGCFRIFIMEFYYVLNCTAALIVDLTANVVLY